MIRALALVPYPLDRVGGQRYRIEQWAPLLRAHDMELHFAPFLTEAEMAGVYAAGWGTKVASLGAAYARRLRQVLDTHSFDVAYVYREVALMGGAWLERLLRIPFVYDFDDAIFLRPPVSLNRGASLLKSTAKASDLCKMAAVVTVGNEFLAEYARRHNPRVVVVPSTIDTDRYPVRPRAVKQVPVIGWTGSPTTVCYLELASTALTRLRREINFEMRVVGAEYQLPGVETTLVPWRAETEADDLRPMDIGLMPLEDDDWCRGKCGLKALQYMALGIPPVVSPVGFNKEIVVDGVNGFLASSDDQWVERLLALLRDAPLRGRLGAAARQTVEERFSASVQAPRMAEVLKQAAMR